jgi:DNA-binding CsgD family transcriptional regulator
MTNKEERVPFGTFDVSPRNIEIWQLRRAGKKLSPLAQQFGLSVERVRQICLKLDRLERISVKHQEMYRRAKSGEALAEVVKGTFLDEAVLIKLIEKLDARAVA